MPRQAPHHRHEHRRRRRPSRRRRPGPRPTRALRGSPHTTPNARNIAAAAEVADQVDRRRRLAARAAEVRERAGERDVVDVVAGGLRQRTVLAPAGHARRTRAAGCARGTRRARARVARSRPGRNPSIARRPARPAAARVSTPSGSSGRRRSSGGRGGRHGSGRPRMPRSTCSTRSIRTMSAPMSESSIPANGPGPMPASSTTFTPVSGPAAFPPSVPWARGCHHPRHAVGSGRGRLRT